jgi:hypothetical protein
MGALKQLLRSILAAIRERLTLPTSQAHADELRNHNFDLAKRGSDFVGILVRFAFVYYAIAFFLNRSVAEQGSLRTYVFGLCATLSCGFAIVFGGRIFMIIYANELRHVVVYHNRIARVVALGFAILTTAAIWYGINELVTSLPQPSPKK